MKKLIYVFYLIICIAGIIFFSVAFCRFPHVRFGSLLFVCAGIIGLILSVLGLLGRLYIFDEKNKRGFFSQLIILITNIFAVVILSYGFFIIDDIVVKIIAVLGAVFFGYGSVKQFKKIRGSIKKQ